MKNDTLKKESVTAKEKDDTVKNIRSQKGYKVLDMETLMKNIIHPQNKL